MRPPARRLSPRPPRPPRPIHSPAARARRPPLIGRAPRLSLLGPAPTALACFQTRRARPLAISCQGPERLPAPAAPPRDLRRGLQPARRLGTRFPGDLSVGRAQAGRCLLPCQEPPGLSYKHFGRDDARCGGPLSPQAPLNPRERRASGHAPPCVPGASLLPDRDSDAGVVLSQVAVIAKEKGARSSFQFPATGGTVGRKHATYSEE